jgi:hypothetical protein
LVPATALFLVLVRPLADHHLVLLSAAYAIAAGPSLVLAIAHMRLRWLRLAAAGAVALMVLAGLFQEQRRLHRNDVAEPAEITWAAAALRLTTRPDDVVVSDQPIVPFLARRPQPGPLVDTSNTRISGGGLMPSEVLAELERARPAAVVVGRMLRTLPRVLARLREQFPRRIECGTTALYLRAGAAEPPPCSA